MLFAKNAPWYVRAIMPPNLIWEFPNADNEVFLTFDDGPHPIVTPFVLDCLKAYNMKGTFFCIGKNVVEYPHIYKRILEEGHAVGNHTMNHLNGFKTSMERYAGNIIDAQQHIDSLLFRPPYGRIKRSQALFYRNEFSQGKIVMWSVLTGDFDQSLKGEQCFDYVKKYTKSGSIIVFHDSEKAFERLKVALPLTLEWLAANKFQAVTIKD